MRLARAEILSQGRRAGRRRNSRRARPRRGQQLRYPDAREQSERARPRQNGEFCATHQRRTCPRTASTDSAGRSRSGSDDTLRDVHQLRRFHSWHGSLAEALRVKRSDLLHGGEHPQIHDDLRRALPSAFQQCEHRSRTPEYGYGAIRPEQPIGDAEESGRAEQLDPLIGADDALGPVHVQPGIGDERAKAAAGDLPAGLGLVQDPRAVQAVLDNLGEQPHARLRYLTHQASVFMDAWHGWLESVPPIVRFEASTNRRSVRRGR